MSFCLTNDIDRSLHAIVLVFLSSVKLPMRVSPPSNPLRQAQSKIDAGTSAF